MEREKKKANKKKISKKRRNNAMLYPIYKMFSWDLLCYYSIEFLFLTITKRLTASQVLMLTSVYIISKIIFQIPSVILTDFLGKRKSMIIGNVLVALYLILLIYSPNVLWIIIAMLFCGFGYDLKIISEANLLYDSVSTRGGDGIYTQIDSKGSSAYYMLDTILSIIAGYIFVINNYIPLYISLTFIVISIILSAKFKYIYVTKENKKEESFSNFIKSYSNDIVNSFKFIKQSKRMKAYVIFAAVFYGIIKVMTIYRNDLLVDIGVTEEQFSIIYALLTLIAGISVTFSKKTQKYFKNKTLTVLSLSYIISNIIIGIITISITNTITLPLVIMFYAVTKLSSSQWFVTQYTYLKNFTTERTRNKISFTYELITGIAASIMSLIGAAILDSVNIKYSVILIGLLFLAIIMVILDYMRTRIGLKPKQYTELDLKFIKE